jgi:GNAT superfamily N-acetyltransferase
MYRGLYHRFSSLFPCSILGQRQDKSALRGELLLIRDGDRIADAAGLVPLTAEVCEFKRLFVRPPWRRRGLGRSGGRKSVD